MSLIINKFNIKSKTQIEFTLKFKLDDNIEKRIENIQKLDKSLNIYYEDSSCTVKYRY